MKTELNFEIMAYIKGGVSLNISASQIYDELCQILGASVLCKRSVFRWHKTFKDSKTDLKDAPLPILDNPRLLLPKLFSTYRVCPKKPTFLPSQIGFQY